MSDINKALGNHGGPRTLTVAGKPYLLAWPDQKMLAAFCEHIKSTARNAVLLLRNGLPEDVFLAMLQRLAADMAPPRSQYEPFGDKFMEELRQPDGLGIRHLFWLMLHRHHPTITEEEAGAIALQSFAEDPGAGPDRPGELVATIKDMLAACVEEFAAGKRKPAPAK